MGFLSSALDYIPQQGLIFRELPYRVFATNSPVLKAWIWHVPYFEINLPSIVRERE